MDTFQLITKNFDVIKTVPSVTYDEKNICGKKIATVDFYKTPYYSFFDSLFFKRKEKMKTNENSGIETIVTDDSNGSSVYLNCVFTENIDFVKRFSITAINTIECLSINILHKNLLLPNGPEIEILQHIFREKDTTPDTLKNVILLFIQDFENENSSEKDVREFIEKKLTSLWKIERKDVKSSYSKFFDFQVYFLPNKKYETAKFTKTCEIILNRIEEELSRFDYTDDGSETVDETIKKFLVKWKHSDTESEKKYTEWKK